MQDKKGCDQSLYCLGFDLFVDSHLVAPGLGLASSEESQYRRCMEKLMEKLTEKLTEKSLAKDHRTLELLCLLVLLLTDFLRLGSLPLSEQLGQDAALSQRFFHKRLSQLK